MGDRFSVRATPRKPRDCMYPIEMRVFSQRQKRLRYAELASS